jgi:hypothetical protein
MSTTWSTVSGAVTQSLATQAANSKTDAGKLATGVAGATQTLSDGTTSLSALHYADAAASSATTAAGSVTSAAAEVVLAEAQVVLATNQVALATSAGAAQVVLAAAQVTLAAAQVTLSEAQVTLATAQATAAATSATEAAAVLALFESQYHGASATAPTGASVTTGDLWFDTSVGVNAMKTYDGSSWVAAFISASGMLTATNNLSDLTSASSSRTNLGLAIGTNVQAYDADLAAIAGLTSAADRLAYYTGSGAASLATFSTAGRALVDDADAAAQRTTLGLGTMATQGSGAVSISGGSVVGITDLLVADGGTGQGSYLNGELLIGNTTGNTLAKATITAGTGISVTNGASAITIANTQAAGISMGKAVAAAIVFG